MASSSRTDPQPPDRSPGAATSSRARQEAGAGEVDFLGLVATAEDISRRYQQQSLNAVLGRSYRAWQNQHAEGSKYLGPAWRGRTRLFVPKTRAAVRKNLAAAAAALFSTDDVVNVSAQYEDDPVQRATAAVVKADLEYRLSRTSKKSGVPWFLIAMGACLDSQLTGCCVSKQHWEYMEVPTGEYTAKMAIDPETGMPMIDPQTGMPMMVETEDMRAVKDRPMIELIPIENVGVDPAAPWYAPAQLGAWFFVDYPMHLTDARAMMASSDKGGAGGYWLEVDDATLLKGKVQDEQAGNRRAREGGADRYEDARTPGDLDIVWIRENFFRIDGTDYHFWSVGRHGYLSEVRETRDAYPEFDGDRPYEFGVSQLDTHRVFPMPPVESWQPLQLELNDIANLRLDTLKRAIAPLPVVKRGRNVDLTALQRRGQPDTILLTDDPADITFQQTPGPSSAAYTETSVTNALFDELAGVFATSSVQTNRQLNETVGGMRLMAGSANAVSEFDLRVWVETWVEPVLRQVMHLVQQRESDEALVALAGSKARSLNRFGFIPGLEDFEAAELALRVNVGIGAADPMQKLSKLDAALRMLTPMFEPMTQQGITVNMEAIIEEVMGASGYRDGRRFFEFGEPPQDQEQGPPPELMKLMEEMKLERERLTLERERAMLQLQAGSEKVQADNSTRLQIEQMRGQTAIAKEVIGAQADRAIAEQQHRDDRVARLAEIFAGRGGGPSTPDIGEETGPQLPVPVSPQSMPQPQQANGMGSQIVVGAVLAQLSQLSEQITSVGGMVADLGRRMAAPSEIVRDPQTGQLIAVRRAGQTQMVRRDQGGNIIGTEPMQQ